jgi:hypothetical protein
MTVLYERSPEALWRTSDGQVVLLVADSDDEPFTITGPGAVLWTLLDVPSTADSLASSLAKIYEAEIDEIRRGIRPLLDTLVEKRAVYTLDTP